VAIGATSRDESKMMRARCAVANSRPSCTTTDVEYQKRVLNRGASGDIYRLPLFRAPRCSESGIKPPCRRAAVPPCRRAAVPPCKLTPDVMRLPLAFLRGEGEKGGGGGATYVRRTCLCASGDTAVRESGYRVTHPGASRAAACKTFG